ncbi:hypothetical protein [Chondrinema litorale]|uniref:hypothetical protein n=1 Tax=Chondrinema litorale TaxID=2994555 RepID=UPI0025439CE9|nr:hypothetical protein [Chondrinema litorale]UZR92748.1 hypothetical protein OQ292_12855 [Chondrinema litorale]
MKYKRNSVFVYVLLLAVLSFMISLNRGNFNTDNSIQKKKVSFPIQEKTQDSKSNFVKTVFEAAVDFKQYS